MHKAPAIKRRHLFTYILIVLLTTSLSSPIDKTVDDLLKKPFDLQKFKEAKGQSNSGGATKRSYYFKPDTAGMYYSFFLFPCLCGYIGETPNKNVHMEDGLQIVTYKPNGKYKADYLDPTETLIEVIARFNDNDLPELAFVGLDTVKIKQRLGDNFIRKDNCFIYTKDKSALTLKIKGKTVEWLKYTRLNISLTKDNVPSELVTMN